ncbi:MAG: histone deacetylase [Hadesarchaea archaeon]|jgi:acetoin utilization deacetylase AcuC-like enzyme|nr:MAG: histone deacetylase [Hadesarchaea archaeon]
MMKIVYSPRCLEYGSPFHLEGPDRVRRAYEILRGLGYRFVEPKPAGEEDLLLVHSREHVERIRRGNFFDPDTPAYPGIYEYARLAAGGALLAAELEGFSLLRPPGHHAGRSGRALGAPTLGFCYFNNLALAVRKLDLPTLIVDIDGHHGNGTQEIFAGDPKVRFVSLHRAGIYPGTGWDSGPNFVNVPLDEVGDELYLKYLDRALRRVGAEECEVIAVSAGFDSHAGDLSSLGLTTEGFRRIGERLAEYGKPVFGVLEGGYIGENVGRDLHALLEGLQGRA